MIFMVSFETSYLLILPLTACPSRGPEHRCASHDHCHQMSRQTEICTRQCAVVFEFPCHGKGETKAERLTCTKASHGAWQDVLFGPQASASGGGVVAGGQVGRWRNLGKELGV